MPAPQSAIAMLPLACFLLLSCSPDTTQPSPPSTLDPAGAPASVRAASTTSALPPFDPDNFVTGVDNPLFPLPLGRRLVYRGAEDGELLIDIVDVTRDRKTVLGVQVITVLDRVFKEDALAEKTFDWYAQDRQGNVWYLGEGTKEFEDGRVVTTAG